MATAPILNKVIEAFADEIQELEDTAIAVLICRFLEHANNAQLDGLGDIVGETRLGQADPEYRLAIRRRIFVNRSSGTPNELIRIVKDLAVATSARLYELFPGKVRIQLDVLTVPAGLEAYMQDVAAGGVDIKLYESGNYGFRSGRNRSGERL